MSHSSSIGTGTPQDHNENHPTAADHWPSRTLGGDLANPDAPQKPSLPAQDDVPAEAAQAEAPQADGLSDIDRMNEAFPDGPNVAPSPWESEAARGRA